MKFSEFYSSSDKDELLSLEKSEQKDSTDSSHKPVDQIPYVVVPGHDAAEWGETLIIADVEKGTVVGRISARGRLISHPVVHGDKCSFAVQQQDGSALGTTHDLPSGSLSTTFRIGGAGAKDVGFNPIFSREEDLTVEPGSKLAQDITKIATNVANDILREITPAPKEDTEEVIQPAQEEDPIGPPATAVQSLAPARIPGQPHINPLKDMPARPKILAYGTGEHGAG
jgi:hypothetical protein